MALNASGPISLAGVTAGQSIQLELGGNGTTQISLNDATVRALAGVASGAITMPTDFWGKSSFTPFFTNNTFLNAGANNAIYGDPNPTSGLVSITAITTNLANTSNVGRTQKPITYLNQAGDVVFNRQIASPASGNFSPLNSCVCNDGSSYVIGVTNLAGLGTTTPYVARYNAAGVLQWQRAYGYGTTTMNAQSCSADLSNNVYVAIYNSVNLRIEVIKIDTSGNLIWARAYTIPAIANRISIVFNSTRTNFWVFSFSSLSSALSSKFDLNGNRLSTIGVNTCASVFSNGTADDAGNVYYCMTSATNVVEVVKQDPAGTILWRSAFTALSIGASDITVTPDGSSVYAVFNYSLALPPDGIALPQNNTIKFDSSGVVQWQRSIVGPNPGVFTNVFSAGILKVSGGNLYYNLPLAQAPRGFNQYGYPAYEAVPGFYAVTDAQMSAATKTFAGRAGTISITPLTFASAGATTSTAAYTPTDVAVTYSTVTMSIAETDASYYTWSKAT